MWRRRKKKKKERSSKVVMARQSVCHELHNRTWIFGIVLPWAPESPNKYSSPTSSDLITSLIRGLKHARARNTNLYRALRFHFKVYKENTNKGILCWSRKPASNVHCHYSKSFCVELSDDYGYTIPSFVKMYDFSVKEGFSAKLLSKIIVEESLSSYYLSILTTEFLFIVYLFRMCVWPTCGTKA